MTKILGSCRCVALRRDGTLSQTIVVMFRKCVTIEDVVTLFGDSVTLFGKYKVNTSGILVAPYRAILRYYRCDTPYRAILLKGG